MKKILFRLLALLIGIVISLVSLESFLCLNPKFGYNYHSFRFKSDKLSLNNFGYMRPSSLLGYEHIPNYDSKINSYGLIGKEYKIKKDKNIFRILILGDSIAEQGYINEFLETELNNQSKLGSKYKFEVWNAGVASYDVRRYALYLKHKGLSYNPDMVIIFLFMNDFNLNTNIYYKNEKGTIEYCFFIPEVSKIFVPNPFFMRYSYLYRFIILRLESFLINKRKIQGIHPHEYYGKYYLQMIRQICQEKNLLLFVVISPYLKSLDLYEDWQMHQYLTICKVVKDLEISFLNLYDLYEQLLKESYPLRDLEKDEIHPSREAHRLITKKTTNFILDNFLNKDYRL